MDESPYFFFLALVVGTCRFYSLRVYALCKARQGKARQGLARARQGKAISKTYTQDKKW
jgi:hypothetical protein